MSVNSLDLKEIRAQQPRFEGFTAGHKACAGCGAAIIGRVVLEATGPDVVVANATGCLEVFSTAWPQSSWRVPWLHSVFENGGAIAAGVEAALKAQGRPTKVVAFGGDGGTFDIGFQALSGMLERNHDVLYVCYDNEAYMNTGIQRSSSTPHAAATTTSPYGVERMGKRHLKKDIVSIVAAHHIPFAATASVAYLTDLKQKVRRAIAVEGPAFLHIHSPCPLGWGHDGSLSIEVARLAVETGMFPVIELERGYQTGCLPIRDPRPVTEYLRPQKRFQHLFRDDPRAREELAHLQAIADHNIERFSLRAEKPGAGDSSGAMAAQRDKARVEQWNV